MSNENNKMQVDIENLFKQNVNDLSSIKELYRKLKEMEEKITQVKYIDNTLVKKLKKEYEKLKKIILAENIQVQLDNKIDEFNLKLTHDIETINSQLNNDIETINSQLDTIANISNGININSLLQSSKRVILPKGVYSIDVTMPKGTTLIGDGEDTWIQGNLIVDSNCTVENLKIGTKGKSCTLSNNTTSVIFNNVTFTGGVNNSQGSFWVNDKKVSDIKFVNCKFINGEYNGVTLVDKGTVETHIDSITFDNCYFKDNKRMNIECLVRKGANDIVSGYKNITLKNSTLIKNVNGSDSNINISFDSNSLTSDILIKEGGYSKIDNCYIEGGIYAIEIAGASNMVVVNNKVYPYEKTTNILSVSGLKSIKNNLIFNNNKIYGYKDITFEGYYNNIISNYIECNSLTLRESHCSNINSNEIISTKVGVPILIENSSNNIITNNNIKCLNASYVFGFYYEGTKYNNVFNNKIDSSVNYLHEYKLGSLKKDNIWGNYDNKGLRIADLIRIKNRTTLSTTTELFKLKVTEVSRQPEIFVKCKWFGRHNNNTIGGEFLLNFGKYNQKGNIPTISSSGTPVTISVSNENDDYTYIISTESNSTLNCIIEIITSANQIDLVDII